MSAPAQGLYLVDIAYPAEYGLKNPVAGRELPFA